VRDEIASAEKKMVTAIDALKHQFGTLRTGRASAALLDGVMVNSYGTEVPIKQVCSLTVPESNLIVAQPWDPKMCGEIDKAIRKADLGLNPVSDGKIVRVPVPSPTEERRKELVKRAHHIAEEVRVEVRRFRHEANDTLKKMMKDKKISEDDERRGLEEVQKLTDKRIIEVDSVLKAKEEEILKV
jgi:ribosome recycling factor